MFMQKVEEIVDDFAREYKGFSPSSDAWEQYTAMKDRAVVKLVALIAADRAGLVEALQCAEYAFIHPESNQQFALKAVQDAITQIEQALKEGK